MQFEALLNELKTGDLQEQHQEIAEAIGLNNLIELSKNFGGTQVYIPMPVELVKNLKYRRVAEEYDGSNIQQLAVKYKISESTAYRIIRGKISTKKNSPFEGQTTFFN